MKHVFAALAALVMTFATARAAWATSRNPAQEEAVDRAVAAVDAALVDKVHEGNDAMDRGDPAAAVTAYAAVHARAKDVVAITRRLCTAESRSGATRDGIVHCREALTAEASAENNAALATALLMTRPLMSGDVEEAFVLARHAVDLAPDAEFAQQTLCEAATAAHDEETTDTCATKLAAIAPDGRATHLFVAMSKSRHADLDGAQHELDAARAAGLDPSTYDAVHAQIEAQRPKSEAWRDALVGTLAGYVGTMFVLFVGGLLLGESATRPSSGRVGRALYGAIIVLSAFSFYVSALLFGAALLAVTLGVVTVFLIMSGATRPIEAFVGVVVLYFVAAAVRALFARVPEVDLGERVPLAKQPALREALEDVSRVLRAPTIDEVYVRPDATLEVVARGGLVGHLRKRNVLAIVVGVAALEGLTRRGFEALVASELGRFRDRAGTSGAAAIVEERSLDELAERMEARGVATAANPAWWFVRLHRAFFSRVAEGAIAWQEARADRWAAEAYGAETLVLALRHAALRAAELDARVGASLLGAIDGQGDLSDLYARAAIDEAPPKNADDLADRLAAITALDAEGRVESDDADQPAWSLFADRAALERSMTERIRETLRERAGFAVGDQSKASTVARA